MDCIFYSGFDRSVFYAQENRSYVMKEIKNKSGELTTQQIVMLVILVTSFAVILFFLFRLNLGKETNQEICHNSVVMRGKSVLPKDAVSLNCKTNYVCITEDGTCDQMTKPEIKKVETENDVYEILANEMVDCWWMFGEGKVDYIGKDYLKKNLYCSICSQIAFDDSLKKEIFNTGEFDKKEFYKYLTNNKIPNKEITYLEYIKGLKDSKNLEDDLLNGKIDFGKINLDKQYYVLMGITSEVSSLGYIAGIGAFVGAGALAIVYPVSIPVTVKILFVATGVGLGGTTGRFVGTIIKGKSGNEYLPPALIETSSKEILECKSIKTLA